MESKYYTPSLEEFYIGFEYEYFYSPLRYKEVAKSNFWEKRIYTGNDFIGCLYPYDEEKREYNAFLRITPHPGNFLTIEDQVRVKYLDASDIEELGFKYIKDDSQGDGNFRWYDLFEYGDYELGTYGWLDITETSDKFIRDLNGKLWISIKDKTRTPNLDKSYKKKELFEGKVKNKSELKKVLQMLHIK